MISTNDWTGQTGRTGQTGHNGRSFCPFCPFCPVCPVQSTLPTKKGDYHILVDSIVVITNYWTGQIGLIGQIGQIDFFQSVQSVQSVQFPLQQTERKRLREMLDYIRRQHTIRRQLQRRMLASQPMQIHPQPCRVQRR